MSGFMAACSSAVQVQVVVEKAALVGSADPKADSVAVVPRGTLLDGKQGGVGASKEFVEIVGTAGGASPCPAQCFVRVTDVTPMPLAATITKMFVLVEMPELPSGGMGELVDAVTEAPWVPAGSAAVMDGQHIAAMVPKEKLKAAAPTTEEYFNACGEELLQERPANALRIIRNALKGDAGNIHAQWLQRHLQSVLDGGQLQGEPITLPPLPVVAAARAIKTGKKAWIRVPSVVLAETEDADAAPLARLAAGDQVTVVELGKMAKVELPVAGGWLMHPLADGPEGAAVKTGQATPLVGFVAAEALDGIEMNEDALDERITNLEGKKEDLLALAVRLQKYQLMPWYEPAALELKREAARMGRFELVFGPAPTSEVKPTTRKFDVCTRRSSAVSGFASSARS